MRLSLLSLTLLCFSALLSAQSLNLQGQLKLQDGQPLEGAAITLTPLKRSTISDAKGQFSFKELPAGSYQLSVEHIGVQPLVQSIMLSKSQDLGVLQLSENRELMEEAVVSGRSLIGGERGLRELSGSAHYLGLKTLEQYEYNDVTRLLRSVPGVYIQEEDGLGLRPNIGMRGTGVERSSKITLMEDGILAAPAPYTAPAAYYFPTVGRMQGVEVRKGSSQIEYGPYTTGGALNFLSTAIPEKLSGKLDFLMGNFGQQRLHAHAGQSFDQVGFVVESYQASSDGFKELDGGGNTGFEVQDYQAKLRFNTKKEARIPQSLEFKVGQTINNSNETYLGLSRADFERTPYRRYAATALDRIETKQNQYAVHYRINPAEKLKLSASAYRNEFSRDWFKSDKVISGGQRIGLSSILDAPNQYPTAFASLQGQASDTIVLKHNNRSYYSQGVQLGGRYQWGDEWSQDLKFGLRYHEDGVDRFQWEENYQFQNEGLSFLNSTVPGTESNRLEDAQALAAHAEYRVNWKAWTLSPGIRYENIYLSRADYGKNDPERTGADLSERSNRVDVWMPGLGLRYDLNPQNHLFLGVHKGFTPPGSVPETLPEESWNWELGSRWQWAGFSGQGVLFFNAYERLLGSDLSATGGLGTAQLFNGGSANVYGLEFQVERHFGLDNQSAWSFPVSVSYTFTRAEFSRDFESDFEPWGEVLAGDLFPYLAPHLLNLQAGAQYRRLQLQANFSYIANMRTVAGQGEIALEELIPEQLMLDLSATYHLNYHFSLFASVRNATDQVNLVAIRPAGLRPAMPRSFLVGIKTRF